MLYAVSPLAQKKEVDRYCFNECGKILIGGIEIAGGAFLPCNQDDCPFEDKVTEIMGRVFDDDVKVRKLKAVIE